jgi:DNA-binding CsgD family transcriptional regulator
MAGWRKKSKTNKDTLAARERLPKIMEMRKAGATYKQIATALNMSAGGVHNAVTTELRKFNADIADKLPEFRQLELERLDAMQLYLWPKVKTGNCQAVNTVLRIMERRAKVLGTDAPIKVDAVTAVVDAAGISDQSAEEIRRKILGIDETKVIDAKLEEVKDGEG